MATHNHNLKKIRKTTQEQVETQLGRVSEAPAAQEKREFDLEAFYEFLIAAGEGEKVKKLKYNAEIEQIR